MESEKVGLNLNIQKMKIMQEATVRMEYETTDWLKIGKGVRQGCILSLCLFNLYAGCIMRNARMQHKL